MNLLVLGATGGTGRALVEQALQQGHVVTAFARDPAKVKTKHENLRVARGNILDYDSIEAALKGQDAVLSALGVAVPAGIVVVVVIACQVVARITGLSGPQAWLVRLGIPIVALLVAQRRTTTLSDGTRNVIRAMEKLGVRRFICESSLGVGDSKGQLGFVYNWFVIPLFLRSIFADKERQERAIRDSNLDWVIVRPGALTNGPRTGKYQSWVGPKDKSAHSRISRADTADFMLRQLSEDGYLGKAPAVSY